MSSSRSTSVAELLLQLLELMSLGATRADQATKQLRRAHPFSGLARRIGSAIEMLEAEGLIESSSDGDDVLYRTTPSGLATLERQGRFPGAAAVLFTDIVGSTELIGEFGEAGAHTRRQRHFSLLREAIATCGGREVKSLGDGLMVVFADPVAAIECAIAMQRGVARDCDRLGLRIGLHAGDVLREGNDFFGTTVIIARRLCESAQAGQIVVSEDTCALTNGTGDSGGEPFESLGSVELKGLSEPVCASTLRWSQGPAPGYLARLRRARHPAVEAAR
ncbi:MAG: adenylate/guanylate cyclase domain-containing protein [Thermoleophilia bacterium]|nr:adenylate/guanylate cyclase domain-containing protein [Thermoleophilia bacterium]